MPSPTHKIKTFAITAAVLTTIVGAGGMFVAHTRDVARAEVARLVTSLPGLSVGAVDVETFGGRVTLRDVAMAKGSLHVYARTLSLSTGAMDFAIPSVVTPARAEADRPIRMAQWPRSQTETPAKEEAVPDLGIDLKIPGTSASPAAPPAAPPKAAAVPTGVLGTASATDVIITTDLNTYTIKKIDLTGTPLSNSDVAALLDPKNSDTIAARLKKVTARSIVMPLITQVGKASGNRAEVSQVLLADVVDGKIGAASAAGTTASAKTATTDSLTKTGAIQASGIDLGLFAQIIDTRRTDDSLPLKPLAETVSVSDISNIVHDSAGSSTASIAVVTEKNVMARPLKTDLKTVDAPADEATTSARQKALLDDVLGSFSFGSVVFEKIILAVASQKDPIDFTINKVGFSDFHDRTFGGFTMRDILVTRPTGKGSVATVDIANFMLPPFAKADPASSTPELPSIGKFDLTKLDIDTAAPDPDGAVTKVKFKIAHIGATGDQAPGQSVKKGTLAVDNVTFDVPSETSVGKQFDTMGYPHVDLSGAIDASYDQTAEMLLIPKFQVSGIDMGSVTLGIDLANVNKTIMSTNQEVSKAAAIAMLLKRVDVKIVNSGLFDKALALKAKQDGKTVAEEKDAGIAFFGTTLPESLGNGPGIKAIGAAVVAFLREPKTLHVAASSKNGLGAADIALFGAPDELLNRLDIKADANQ